MTSKTWRRLGALSVLGLLVMAGAWSLRAQEPEEKRGDRRVFMRQKLEFSKAILEGLSVEDFDEIVQGARKLKTLSQAAEWEVPMIPDVDQYLTYTADFQRIADTLDKKAKAKNLDGATLAFTQLTINCVHCHKYVRDTKDQRRKK